MFYLTTHSTHFIYGYMASDIWLRTILMVRKETPCRHIGYYFRLAPRVLLYAYSHRQDNTNHSLCYTSRGALAGTREIAQCVHHEGSIRRPIFPRSYISSIIQERQDFFFFFHAVNNIHSEVLGRTELLVNYYYLHNFLRVLILDNIVFANRFSSLFCKSLSI